MHAEVGRFGSGQIDTKDGPALRMVRAPKSAAKITHDIV
jgi:hypothetical protein